MKQTAEPVVHDPQHKSKIIGEIHKYLEMIIIVVIVIIVVIAGLVINKYREDHKAPPLACSAGEGLSLVKQASAEFSPGGTYKLSQTALKILSLKNYQRDPNCLYVLITSEVNESNNLAATAYLNDFNKVYNGHNLDNVLSKYKSVDSLRNSVKDLKKPAFYGIP